MVTNDHCATKSSQLYRSHCYNEQRGRNVHYNRVSWYSITQYHAPQASSSYYLNMLSQINTPQWIHNFP